MVPTIRCRALEFIADIMINSAHEGHNTDRTALVGVAESQAEASGCPGGGKESLLLETAAVGVAAPAEQMAPAIDSDQAPMAHGTSVARGDALDAEQSFRLVVLF